MTRRKFTRARYCLRPTSARVRRGYQPALL